MGTRVTRTARHRRCPWAATDLSILYHDEEWGVPARDERTLFEFLVLEGAQAGLSWETILRKREGYRRAFAGFDPEMVARFGARDVRRLLADPGIVRNRLKVESAIANARAVLAVREEHGSFADWLWGLVGGAPRINRWRSHSQVPAETPESRALSKALKGAGFRFVGPTTCYAFMQAVGMVNDHLVGCYRHAEIAGASTPGEDRAGGEVRPAEVEVIRAAVMVAPGAPIEIRELPEPRIESGAVLLETILSEVCGTDVHLRHGRLSGVPYPIVPGHVSVGRVVETGGEVTDVEGRAIRLGDAVTFLDVHETCHACWYCLVAKQSTRCPKRRVYGITYSAAEGPLGGWAERIWLKPGVHVVPLAEGVTPERWMGAGCGLPTALHAVDRAGIRLGDRVAVQGSGPVGLSAAILARLSGAVSVIVLGDPRREARGGPRVRRRRHDRRLRDDRRRAGRARAGADRRPRRRRHDRGHGRAGRGARGDADDARRRATRRRRPVHGRRRRDVQPARGHQPPASRGAGHVGVRLLARPPRDGDRRAARGRGPLGAGDHARVRGWRDGPGAGRRRGGGVVKAVVRPGDA